MFLTIPQTAEYLNISKSQVRSLLSNDNSFPKPFSFGSKAFRISKIDIDKWIKTRQTSLNNNINLSKISYTKSKKPNKKFNLDEALDNYDYKEGLLDGAAKAI